MKLPVVSGSEAVKAFRKIGYEFDEQHGSHMILRHNEPPHNACRFPTIRNWPKKRFGRCSGRLGLQWKSSHGSRRSRADGDRGKAVYQRLKDPKSIGPALNGRVRLDRVENSAV